MAAFYADRLHECQFRQMKTLDVLVQTSVRNEDPIVKIYHRNFCMRNRWRFDNDVRFATDGNGIFGPNITQALMQHQLILPKIRKDNYSFN